MTPAQRQAAGSTLMRAIRQRHLAWRVRNPDNTNPPKENDDAPVR